MKIHNGQRLWRKANNHKFVPLMVLSFIPAVMLANDLNGKIDSALVAMIMFVPALVMYGLYYLVSLAFPKEVTVTMSTKRCEEMLDTGATIENKSLVVTMTCVKTKTKHKMEVKQDFHGLRIGEIRRFINHG